jgi:hypothetical protein
VSDSRRNRTICCTTTSLQTTSALTGHYQVLGIFRYWEESVTGGDVRGTDRDEAAEALRDRRVEQIKPDASGIDSHLGVTWHVPVFSVIGILCGPGRDRRRRPGGDRSITRSFVPAANAKRGGQFYFFEIVKHAALKPCLRVHETQRSSRCMRSISDLKGSGSVLRAFLRLVCRRAPTEAASTAKAILKQRCVSIGKQPA